MLGLTIRPYATAHVYKVYAKRRYPHGRLMFSFTGLICEYIILTASFEEKIERAYMQFNVAEQCLFKSNTDIN